MSDRLKPIHSKRLYLQILGVLTQQIDDGRYPAGTYLPPERELAEQLEVSRTSVREALIAMEVQGRVSVRVGAGVKVLPQSARAREVVTEAFVGPLELLEARLVVEPETAALAAGNASDADLADLQRSITLMDRDHAQVPIVHDGDREFHIRIAQASRNAALELLVTTLWDRSHTPTQARLGALFTPAKLPATAVEDHRKILGAITNRDPAGARKAMRAHLNRVRRSFLQSVDRT